MDCWQILQIRPTGDERAIKRAYAKLLKSNRPDDDAEAYQRLREAFDQALSLAPYLAAEAAPAWEWGNEQPNSASDASERLAENRARANAAASPPQEAAAFPASPDSQPNETQQPAENDPAGAEPDHRLPPWQWQAGGGQFEYQQFAYNPLPDNDSAPFSGSPNPSLEENERLPENLNEAFGFPPDADGEPFSGSPHAFGSDPCERLLNEIERRFARGGSAELNAAWPHIRDLLEQLPLGDTDNASYHMAEFLRRHEIQHPLLWVRWADYFGWQHDFSHGELSQEELTRLAEYRRAVELIPLFDAGNDTDTPRAAERLRLSYPVTALFGRFLGPHPNRRRRLGAGLAGILLWPYVAAETSREQRWQLQSHYPALSGWYDMMRDFRYGWLVAVVAMLILGLCVMVSINADLVMGILTGFIMLVMASVCAYQGYAFCMGMFDGMSADKMKRWMDIKYGLVQGKVFYLLLLPALSVAPLPDEYWLLKILAFVPSWMYYCFHFGEDGMAWCKVNFSLIGMVWLIFAPDFMPPEYRPYALMATLLWLNANLYLFFERSDCLAKIERPIRQLLEGRAAWWLLPLQVPYAAVLWMLLMPVQAARLALLNDNGMLLEMATLVLAVLLVLPESLSNQVWLFYPVVLLAAGLRYAAERLMRRLLAFAAA